jgi:hypothetical protein
MKRWNWFEILLILAVASSGLYAAFSDAQNLSMRWFIRDDAYYYFKVAQNISEGYGSTFDGINKSNGYHPLWLIACIPVFALARFDLILPLRVLLIVLSGLTAGTSILLYRILGRIFTPVLGALAAIYWAFSTDILTRVYQQGLETGIAAFFIVLFVYKLLDFETRWRTSPPSNRQLVALGILAALVIFSRLDLVFLAGMTGIWIILRKSPMRYLMPLDIVFIVVAALLAIILRVTFKEYYKFSDVAVVMVVVGLLFKLPAAYFLGLYRRSTLTNPARLLKQLCLFAVSASLGVGLVMVVVTPLAGFDGFPRSAIAYDLILTFLFFVLSRLGAVGLWSGAEAAEDEPSPLKTLASNWKTWLAESLAYYGVVFGALAIYMLWNRIAFGTFSPVSGQIKRWWGSLSGNVYGGAASNLLTFFGIDYMGEGNAWHPVSTLLGHWAELMIRTGLVDIQRYLILIFLLGAFVYFTLWLGKTKARDAVTQLAIIPLVCGAWLQVISYHITGYSAFKEWYWIAQWIAVVLILGLVGGMLYSLIPNSRWLHIALWLVAAAWGTSMGVSHWQYIREIMPYGETSPNAPYNDIAAFLEEHTEPGSRIGMTGGGNAGYFISDRTVINMDGLINSYAYFQLLKRKEAGAYLAEIGTDYILANPALINQLPYNGQYTPFIEWMDIRYGGKTLMRYHSAAP